MKKLGLLRHAKSDHDDPDGPDFQRGLNERGRRGARLIGQHVAAHFAQWDMVLASPAERVRQTLAAAGEHAPFLADPIWDRRLYLAEPSALTDVLRDLAGSAKTVLMVGHNPGLQELLLELVPPKRENALFDEAVRKFPTATFAVLNLEVEDWSASLEGSATLAHFTRPRDLDPALGPEGDD